MTMDASILDDVSVHFLFLSKLRKHRSYTFALLLLIKWSPARLRCEFLIGSLCA